MVVNCKTVRIFAYSSTREQSNKRSGTKLKTESETGEGRFFLLPHTRKTLTPRFTDFFTDFEKKNPTVLQSRLQFKLIKMSRRLPVYTVK